MLARLCTYVSGAVANDVGNTFYVDVNSLNCSANGSPLLLFLKKNILIQLISWKPCRAKALHFRAMTIRLNREQKKRKNRNRNEAQLLWCTSIEERICNDNVWNFNKQTHVHIAHCTHRMQFSNKFCTHFDFIILYSCTIFAITSPI